MDITHPTRQPPTSSHLNALMIQIDDSDEPKPLSLEPVRNIGILAQLPLEVQHDVVNRLDPRSLLRLSQVSLNSLGAVQTLQSYKDIMAYAPHALVALKKTGLLEIHTMKQLQAALRFQSCNCCPEFGPYLFLPTCVRCCWTCLKDHPSLRVLPMNSAVEHFCLQKEDCNELPILTTIPGPSGGHVSRKVVSAGVARELGIKRWGDVQLISYHQSLAFLNTDRGKKAQDKFWTGAFLLQKSHQWIAHRTEIPPNDFLGRASVPIPSLRPTLHPAQGPQPQVEHGYFCPGCEHMCEAFQHSSSAMISRSLGIDLDGRAPSEVLPAMRDKAYGEANFREHYYECIGVKRVAQQELNRRAPRQGPISSKKRKFPKH